MNAPLTRTLTVDIDSIKVKNDILRTVKPQYGYLMRSKDDFLGTYRFAASRGLIGVIIHATVKAESETKTTIEFLVEKMDRNTGDSLSTQFLDDYLKLLSKALQGEEINSAVAKQTKSGCLGFLIILIAFGISSLLISCKKDEKKTLDVVFFLHTSYAGDGFDLIVNGVNHGSLRDYTPGLSCSYKSQGYQVIKLNIGNNKIGARSTEGKAIVNPIDYWIESNEDCLLFAVHPYHGN